MLVIPTLSSMINKIKSDLSIIFFIKINSSVKSNNHGLSEITTSQIQSISNLELLNELTLINLGLCLFLFID